MHNIETLIIPEEVTEIQSYACPCLELKTVQFPSGLKKIGVRAFWACTQLESIVLPESLEEIEANAFSDCKNLKQVIFPKNLKRIGEEAFSNCRSLLEVELPDSLEKIGAGAFEDCKNLRSIKIPEQVEIGQRLPLIENCCNLTSIIASPKKRAEAYGYYSTVKRLWEPTGKLRLSRELTCDILTNPEKMVRNKKAVLEQCIETNDAEMLSVLLEHNYIGSIRIREELIELAASKKSSEALATLLDYKERTQDVKKEERAREKKLEKEWNMTAEEMQIKALKEVWNVKFLTAEKKAYELYGYKGEETVVEVPKEIGGIPITHINERAFSPKSGAAQKNPKLKENLNRITEVIFPSGITYMEGEVFAGCQALKKVELSPTLSEINRRMFWGCENLEEVTLPKRLESIAWGVFEDCKSLKKLEMPDSVTYLGGEAFLNCLALQEVKLSSSLEKIGRCDFKNCSNLKQIVIPDSVKEIGNEAFLGCVKLESVTVSKQLKKIGDSALESCIRLKEICLPQSLEEIGMGAFRWCGAMEKLELPNHLKVLGEGAFFRCKALETITVPEAVTEILDDVFFGCIALKTLNLSDKITSMHKSAFAYCPNVKIYAPKGSYAYKFLRRLESQKKSMEGK
ncbi:MAG: leucine-rich repeat protein [bacterium]|nr:leucine-rich repeat protein [bacterium]